MPYRWNVPEEVKKEVSIVDLDNETLYFYHDQMHIFWKKIESGFPFGWDFNEVYLMHKLIVIELMKRKLPHINPINELDKIILVSNKRELTNLVNYVLNKQNI